MVYHDMHAFHLTTPFFPFLHPFHLHVAKLEQLVISSDVCTLWNEALNSPGFNLLQTRLELRPILHNDHAPGICKHLPHLGLLSWLVGSRVANGLDVRAERGR